MFEVAELGQTVEPEVYEREVAALREELIDAQYHLIRERPFGVVVVVGGVDGAGKRETVMVLNEWLDPRHVETHGLDEPSDEERERPPMWRFWRQLPPKGKVGVFHGSWYTDPILRRAYRESSAAELDQAMERIRHFERMLTDEGLVVLKFWMHLSKDRQRERLRALSADRRTAWRVTPRDWKHFELYDRFRRISERALRQTSTGEAPWWVVEATDFRFQSLEVGRRLLHAVRARLGREPSPAPRAPPLPERPPGARSLLSTLDLTQKVEKGEYERELERWQGRLNLALRQKGFRHRSLVVVFEGMDAAGKGGCIRRVLGALDARQYKVIPVAAPTEEERAQPYLWRFWRHLPRHGKVAVFDRSWYGRVLVERVEGYCGEPDWLRAYAEIVDFEQQLVENGAVVAKLWLQVSQDEQLRRFRAREQSPHARFKIGPEDWRNREKWPAYERAVNDMLERTSTEHSPWTLVAAEDKRFARLTVLKTLVTRLEKAL